MIGQVSLSMDCNAHERGCLGYVDVPGYKRCSVCRENQRNRTTKWRENNREKTRAQQRVRYYADIEKTRRYHREKTNGYNYDNPIRNRLNYYKANAKKYGREWGLTDEYAITLMKAPCYYCGKLDRTKNGTDICGIDRVNNDNGYILTNSVSCCKLCNEAKHSIPIAMARKIVDFLKGV